jgi:hypothetical protein
MWRKPTLWAGIDAGKAAHHCVAMNADGQHVLSRRVVMKELFWRVSVVSWRHHSSQRVPM